MRRHPIVEWTLIGSDFSRLSWFLNDQEIISQHGALINWLCISVTFGIVHDIFFIVQILCLGNLYNRKYLDRKCPTQRGFLSRYCRECFCQDFLPDFNWKQFSHFFTPPPPSPIYVRDTT